MSDRNSEPDKVIVVVHGVGDPEPGATLNLFARSLAVDNRPLHESQDTLWLTDGERDENFVKTFPVHQRTLQFENQNVQLCEAFWGDLSRVRRGWLGVVQGIFQIIFGLRHVAYVAGNQPGVAATWLKNLGLTSANILHGPVLGVTFVLSILIMAVCGTELIWPDSYKSPYWTRVVLAGCATVAIATAAIGNRLTRNVDFERFWFWVKVTSVFVTGLMLVKFFAFGSAAVELPHHPGLLWYCRVLLVLLGLLWFVQIQILVLMAVCWLVGLFHPRAHRRALHVALLIPALAIGVWGQVIPMLWVTAKQGVGILAQLSDFSNVFDDAIPFLGVQLVMMVVILLTTAIVLFRYFLWRGRVSIEQFNSGRRAPRLIVNRWLQIMFAACTTVGVILVSTLCIYQFFYLRDDFWLKKMMITMNDYAVSILVPLGGLMTLVLSKLRPGFDMILDVINHFYFRPTKMYDAVEPDDGFDIADTTFENGALFFARRDAVNARVKRILAHYRDHLTSRPELIVVSHSQGTMVATEVLNDEELSWLNNSFSSVSLVTMGSPLNHLYQHYFGHFYPALDQPFWCSLQRRVDRWFNICRIDDFVGTTLDFPSATTQHGTDLPNDAAASPNFYTPIEYTNHAVGPRGHQYYWSDRDVLAFLQAEVLTDKTSNQKHDRAAA